MLKITEYDFRQKLKALTSEMCNITKDYLADRPGYVRNSPISIDEDYKSFSVNISVSVTDPDNINDMFTRCDVWAGGPHAESICLHDVVEV